MTAGKIIAIRGRPVLFAKDRGCLEPLADPTVVVLVLEVSHQVVGRRGGGLSPEVNPPRTWRCEKYGNTVWNVIPREKAVLTATRRHRR